MRLFNSSFLRVFIGELNAQSFAVPTAIMRLRAQSRGSLPEDGARKLDVAQTDILYKTQV